MVTYSVSRRGGVRTGKIKIVDVVPTNGDYGFRVSLLGTSNMCGNAHVWAYIN